MSGRYLIEITESSEELKEAMQQSQASWQYERLQALYLLKSQQVSHIQQLPSIIGRSLSSINRWFASYRQGGLSSMLIRGHGGGAGCTIHESIQLDLKAKLDSPQGFGSYLEIQQWLQQEYGLECPYSTVHATVHYRLGGKLKVARPSHSESEVEQRVGFQKNSNPASKL